MRKALSPEKEIPIPEDVEPESKADEDEDEDDDGLKEMEELTNAMQRKRKQAKKTIAKRKEKVCSLFYIWFNNYAVLHGVFCVFILHLLWTGLAG